MEYMNPDVVLALESWFGYGVVCLTGVTLYFTA